MPSKFNTYLGLPIGDNLKSARLLLVKHINKKFRTSYAGIVSVKLNLNRHLLGRPFTSVCLPHVL